MCITYTTTKYNIFVLKRTSLRTNHTTERERESQSERERGKGVREIAGFAAQQSHRVERR